MQDRVRLVGLSGVAHSGSRSGAQTQAPRSPAQLHLPARNPRAAGSQQPGMRAHPAGRVPAPYGPLPSFYSFASSSAHRALSRRTVSRISSSRVSGWIAQMHSTLAPLSSVV